MTILLWITAISILYVLLAWWLGTVIWMGTRDEESDGRT